MASIRKRKTAAGVKYTVLYDYEDASGARKQKSAGSYDNKRDAERAMLEINLKKNRNKFIDPSDETVADFVSRWIPIRAKLKKWEYSYLDTATRMFDMHILPEIGNIPMQKVAPAHIDALFADLQCKRCGGPKSFNRKDSEIPFLSGSTLQSIYNLVKSMFETALDWKEIEENPVKVSRPQRDDPPETEIWDLPMIKTALANISDAQLHLAVHIAAALTCRNGEVCGITWSSIDFDKGMLKIDKTIQRISKSAFSQLPKKDVFKVFPNKEGDSKSMLVLKTPKTKGSVRWLYLTAPLIKELRQRQQLVAKHKLYFGSEYSDNNLVFCLDNGDPIEPKLCEKWFKKWQERNKELELPHIVFHRLRHSAATLLMYLSGSDAKTVQSITGHSSAEFVFDVYNHPLMSRQRTLISKLESVMYGSEQVCINSEAAAILQAMNDNPAIARDVLSALYATVAVDA